MSAGSESGEGDTEEGVCPACKEEVDGACVQACGKNFHPDCFVCGLCSEPFPGGQFFEHEGLPYCEGCYHEHFGVRCHGCKEPITGKCITAMGVKWHKEHFVCLECNKQLAGGSFVEVEKEAHCKPCAKAKKKKKKEVKGIICARCKEVIEGESITLQGQKMHPHHFTCHKCKCAFKGVTCHEYEGRLYCGPHYKELLASQCAQCRKPITGRSITALGKQWHPEHFVCAQCEQPFGGNNYMIQGGKPYCEADWVNLFGKQCAYCEKQIGSGAVKSELADGVEYMFHPEHFKCCQCDTRIGPKVNYRAWEGKAVCTKCFNLLPKLTRDRISQIIQSKKKEKKKGKR